MSFVLDSSVTLAWCFEDESSEVADALLVRLGQRGGIAPAHWPLEVLNALVAGERRGRLDAATRQAMTGFLRELPIRLDDETHERAWGETLALATKFRLTVYDAAYLELAQRLDLPLATQDEALRTAANALGVRLFGKASDPA